MAGISRRGPRRRGGKGVAALLVWCALLLFVTSNNQFVSASTPRDSPLPDYYSILGVGKQAPVAEIRKQYKALAKKWHPDKVQGDEAAKLAAQEKFMAINEAHEILSDPESRREYDESKEDQRRGWSPRHHQHQHQHHNFHHHQFYTWQRAQNHWHQHHQYTQTAPSIISMPLVLIILVPIAFLVLSSVASERANTGTEQQSTTSDRTNTNTATGPASSAAQRNFKAKPAPVVLSSMQRCHIQLAPDLVQIECGSAASNDLNRLESSNVVVFLPSDDMLRKMARAHCSTGGDDDDDDPVAASGKRLWEVLRDVCATFTRSDRIVFAWTEERSVQELRRVVQHLRPSFDLSHPDPAVLVFKRQKKRHSVEGSSSSASAPASASATLGGGSKAATDTPKWCITYSSALAYVCPRHDPSSPKKFTTAAISAWVTKQLCDGMASWRPLGPSAAVTLR